MHLKDFRAALLPSILVVAGVVSLIIHFCLRLVDGHIFSLAWADLPLLAVIIGGGFPLVWQIIAKLFRRDFGADILAAIAIVTAFILHEYLACVIVILMLAGGEVLEAFAIARASSALKALVDRMPFTADRVIGDKVETIEISAIGLGDLIVVPPHQTCPVDGVVVKGHGHMDESYLSGEPYGVKKAPGSKVLSGAINGAHLLMVKTLKIPKDSRYAEIIQVMKDAEEKRPRLRRMADQLGAYFAPITLIVAIAAWGVSGDAVRFLAVLVVATPCPLIIGIPVAIISTISMSARRGIIIKDPGILEQIPLCRTAIFDKTGTLTYGKPHLVAIKVAQGWSEQEILVKTASMERYSKHPLGEGVINEAKKRGLRLLEADQVAELPGKGLIGHIGAEEIIVTNRKTVHNDYPEQEASLPASSVGLECIVLINGKYAATFQFRDAPRAFGKNFIEHLAPHHAFSRVMLVSGDRESEVRYLADELGIKETFSSQSPEQKLALVREETLKSPTLFMGDGINDAPALAAATVGLAFGQETSVSAEAAGAVILESSLIKLDELLHISKRMRTIALQSALGGMILSFIGMGCAFFGVLDPVWGALLQEAIDIAAITNALRLALGKNVAIDMKS